MVRPVFLLRAQFIWMKDGGLLKGAGIPREVSSLERTTVITLRVGGWVKLSMESRDQGNRHQGDKKAGTKGTGGAGLVGGYGES